MSLAKEHCEACVPGTKALDEDAITALRADIAPEWKLDHDTSHIRRHFGFRGFAAAFAAATTVATIAEEEGHHPDIHVGWGYLDIDLTTHVAHGLTRNDFIMAARIDAAL